jgi:large subunit ribosomal protein L6
MLFKFKILKKEDVYFLKENLGYILKGPLGCSLPIPFNKDVNVFIENFNIVIESKSYSKLFLYKRLFLQKMDGVLYGYKKKLKLRGIGYTAEVLDNNLILKLGYSSNIIIKIPNAIKIKIKKRKIVKIMGCDLNQITQFGSIIRLNRVPEIYKGKGVLYFKEKIFLKIGKKN